MDLSSWQDQSLQGYLIKYSLKMFEPNLSKLYTHLKGLFDRFKCWKLKDFNDWSWLKYYFPMNLKYWGLKEEVWFIVYNLLASRLVKRFQKYMLMKLRQCCLTGRNSQISSLKDSQAWTLNFKQYLDRKSRLFEQKHWTCSWSWSKENFKCLKFQLSLHFMKRVMQENSLKLSSHRLNFNLKTHKAGSRQSLDFYKLDSRINSSNLNLRLLLLKLNPISEWIP